MMLNRAVFYSICTILEPEIISLCRVAPKIVILEQTDPSHRSHPEGLALCKKNTSHARTVGGGSQKPSSASTAAST